MDNRPVKTSAQGGICAHFVGILDRLGHSS
jgi:hypothetical protein